MLGCGPAGLIMILAACSSDTESSRASVAATSTVTTETAPSTTAAAARTSQSVSSVAKPGVWRMPSEEDPHERTWMCWPSNTDIWSTDLPDVQETRRHSRAISLRARVDIQEGNLLDAMDDDSDRDRMPPASRRWYLTFALD